VSRICAIVPTCNRADLLPQALDSILRQTRQVDEIIIVNDGSTDNTIEMLRSYADRVTVYSQPNAGKAVAMNSGLAKATADYIWFFDDDDIAADDGIAPLAAALDADPSLTFAYGMHQKFPGDRLDDRRLPDFWAQPAPDHAIINFLGNLYPFQAGMLVRRDAFKHIGPFNADFRRAQDVDSLIRLATFGRSIYLPHIVFYQRGHSGFRGSPSQQLSQEQALAVAVQYDQKALLLNFDRLTLDRVTPEFAEALPHDLRQRAAYLQRACMCARRAVWPQAIADLQAADRSAKAPALPQELARLEVCVVKAQMWHMLISDHESIAQLRRLRAGSDYGKAIVTALLKPMPWHIRTAVTARQFRQGWHLCRLLVDILGIGGAAKLFLAKLLS
jgi:GT2 family glycosyltransferase